MKIFNKLIATAIAPITAMYCSTLTVSADKLKTVDGIMYRYSDSGESKGAYTGFGRTNKGIRCYKNGLPYKSKHIKTSSGKRYLTDDNGYLTIGWKHLNDGWHGWHWFSEKGVEAIGDTEVLGVVYFFDKNGMWWSYGTEYTYFDEFFKNLIPQEYYGGFIIDKDTLVIKTTDVESIKSLIPAFYPIINIEECKFTLKQLESTAEIINNHDFHTSGKWVEVKLEQNYVLVEFDELNDSILDFIDSLEYKECVYLRENPPVLDD